MTTINIDRIKTDMDHINSITSTPGQGCTRLSYSKEDKLARNYIKKELNKIGAQINVDGVGNIRAKYGGKASESSIMIGSHIDTVPNGGRYDGLTGTIVALETIRTVRDQALNINHPLELVIFAEEEGSNFGSTTLGSKLITGDISLDKLHDIYTDNGVTAYEYIKEAGYDIDSIKKDQIRPEEVKAMLELHVEQGSVLDTEQIPVGIVNAIAGMNTYQVKIIGQANHAGSTPMNMRKDALAASAEIILSIENFAKNKVNKTSVATIGKLDCQPSASNVINGLVEFNVDIRDVDQNGIEKMSEYLLDEIDRVCQVRDLEYDYSLVGESRAEQLSEDMVRILETKANELGIEYKIMHSGAVHDAMMLNKLTKVGMLFVPSKHGISHSPKEETSFDDIELGAELFYNAVVELAV